MTADKGRYLGKFRGTVVENRDPMGIGRIQASVPDALGDTPSSWAMPCFPMAGPKMGQYVIPPKGAGVWIEFEQGDLSYPIWSGAWYGTAQEVPAAAVTQTPDNSNVVVQSPGERLVLLSDEDGENEGITLRHPSGAYIKVDKTGVHINNGRGAVISLVGDTVKINNDAFSVT